MIRKLKIFALLGTLALWSINCSSGGGTPPPDDTTAGVTFNYVCPNGTPTAGTTSVQGTQSCKACNEPDFSLSGTDCQARAGFSFVCENGVAAAGTNPTEDTRSCQDCNNNYALDGTASAIGTTCIVELDGTFRRIGASGIAGIISNGLASITDSSTGTPITTLYMTGSKTENGVTTELLYTVNINTGVATQVGPFRIRVGTPVSIGPTDLASIGTTLYIRKNIRKNFAYISSSFNPTDLASIGTTLYMVGGGTSSLYRVNTTSGEVTRVGTVTVRNFGVAEISPQGLASITDSSTGTPITTLYMVGDTNNALYTVDTTTGEAEQVGTAMSFGVAETFPRGLTSIGTTLYMVGNVGQSMYTVDTTTGSAEQVGVASFFGTGNSNIQPKGLASIGNTLYMVDEAGRLYAAP